MSDQAKEAKKEKVSERLDIPLRSRDDKKAD